VLINIFRGVTFGLTRAIRFHFLQDFQFHFQVGENYNQYTKIDCLIAQDKMKSRFYKIKCTAASDQILNCQPKIVIPNLAKLLCGTQALTFYFHCAIFQHGAGLSRSLIMFKGEELHHQHNG
jgi:hypothetical protein